MSKKHLSRSEKRKKRKREEKLIKSQRGAIDKFILKNVDFHANLNLYNENLNNENHVSEAENEEVNHSSKPNNVSNASNIENIGINDDKEHSIPLLDIYDLRN